MEKVSNKKLITHNSTRLSQTISRQFLKFLFLLYVYVNYANNCNIIQPQGIQNMAIILILTSLSSTVILPQIG